MVINTNIMAQSTANLLGASSQRLSHSLARLSSGSKINSPADDAAGLAVSMNFNAQIGRTDAANNNVSNALSFSQTQDGYLQQVSNALNRMSELAVQAQDVTKSDSDRKLYNQEFQTLATYINNVGTKDFNGVSLFTGNDLNVTSDSEGGTFQMKGINNSFLTGSTTSSAPPANTPLNTLYPSMSGVQYIGNNGYEDGPDASGPISALVDSINVLGGLDASYDESTGTFTVTVSPGETLTQYPGDSSTPATTVLSDMGIGDLDNTNGNSPLVKTVTLTSPSSPSQSGSPDVSTADDAKAALTTIKNAISNLASKRADIGSNMERLNSTSQELSTLANNLSAANSRITDVDVAQESTNYAKENILVQTGTAMLAQANSAPQSVLKLLG
jgi:flagellin